MTTHRYHRPLRPEPTGLITEDEVNQTLAEFEQQALQLQASSVADRQLASATAIPYPVPTKILPKGITEHTRTVLAKAGIPETTVPKYSVLGTAEANLRKDVFRPYLTPEMVQKLPGPARAVGIAARELTSPAQLALLGLTAGIGPALAGALKGGTGVLGAARGVAASAVAPVVQGGVAARIGGEAAVGTAANLAAQETAKRVQHAPAPIRVGAPLAAGLVGGAGALAGVRGLPHAVAAAKRAVPVVERLATEESGAVGRTKQVIISEILDAEKAAGMPPRDERNLRWLSGRTKEALESLLSTRKEPPTSSAASEALSPAAKPAQTTTLAIPKVSRNLIASRQQTARQAVLQARDEAAYQAGKTAFRKTAGPIMHKEPWQMTEAEFASRYKQPGPGEGMSMAGPYPLAAHRMEVERALQEGKAVPPEVLAEYPEFVSLKAPVGAEPAAVSEWLGQQAQTAERASTGAPGTAGQGSSSVPGSAVPPMQPPKEPPVGLGAVGPMPPEEPFAANIRLVKYPENLRPIIKAWADANPDTIEAARRGVRSDAQVRADAERLVNDLGGDFEKMVKEWKPGQAWNAEEITAIRGALADATQEIVDAQGALAAGIDTSENQLRLVEALYRRAQIQEAVHGITAEAGRSLRAFRQQAAEALQNHDTVRMAALLKRLEGKGAPEQIVAELAKVDMNNPRQLADVMRSFTKPKWWEYPLEILINGYLSAPTSHAVNSLSNAGMVAISPVRRTLAATTEAVAAPLQGRARQRFFSEVPADVLGAVQGIPEGLRSFLYVMRNGQTPEAALKYELPRVSAFTGKLGRVINAPSQLMTAADQLFYHINYRAALNAEAVRAARSSPRMGMGQVERAAELLNNPSSALIAKAAKAAEYNLFRNEPGAIVKQIMGLREHEAWGVPIGRFLFPFVRTPANLLSTGLGHSPLGLLNGKMWAELGRKDPAFADRFASVLFGTAVASTLALYFAKGHITGAAPTGAAERNTFFNIEHKLPYSVKLGDHWIPFNRLAPLDDAIGLIGSTIQAYQTGDETTSLAKAGIVITTLGRQFTQQPYMTALSSIMDALDSPTDKGAALAERLLAGFLPFSGLVRQTATTIDPTYRQPQSLGEQLQAEIPGQTQNVPPRLTAFGEQPQRTSPSVLPFAWSPADMNPVEAELDRLKLDAGFVSGTVGGVELTRQQKSAYQIAAGQKAMHYLSQVVDLPQYKALPDEIRQTVLEAEMQSAHRAARYELHLGKEPKPDANERPLRVLERTTMAASPLVQAYRDAGDAVLRNAGREDMVEAYHEYLRADNLTQLAMNKQSNNLFKQTASAEGSVKAMMRKKNAALDGYYVRYEDGAPKNHIVKKHFQEILATDTFLSDLLGVGD